MPRTRLRDLTEGELLEQLFPRFGGITGPAAVPLGPGDDAAVLAAPSGSVVLTTDSMVRGRDWRDDWSSAREVGLKVVAQNIADIAAMGAVPTGLLVALAADPETEVAWALELAEGIAQAAGEAGAPVLGGDLSSAVSGTVVVAITATGDLEGRPPVRRDGARPGDVVAVRGGRLGLGGRRLRRLVGPAQQDGHLLDPRAGRPLGGGVGRRRGGRVEDRHRRRGDVLQGGGVGHGQPVGGRGSSENVDDRADGRVVVRRWTGGRGGFTTGRIGADRIEVGRVGWCSSRCARMSRVLSGARSCNHAHHPRCVRENPESSGVSHRPGLVIVG